MTTDQISKGERDELRRVVRGDFKALASEVDVRRAELIAEIELRVAERFKASEAVIAEAETVIDAMVTDCNTRIVEALHGVQESCEGYEIRWSPLTRPMIHFVRQNRDELRRAMLADLDARVAQARATMLRQENDLLKKLASGALESDAARAFLAEIPTVSALVPSSRLAELEAQFDEVDGE